jgi:hypothetical protein
VESRVQDVEFRRAVEALKRRVDLHDLAEKLGMERPGGGSGNYRSPTHPDKNPSLSIFNAKDGGQAWKDHSSDKGGSAVDLVMYVQGCSAADAIRELAEMYSFELPDKRREQPPTWREKTRAEFIAERVAEASCDPAIEYLVGRGISEQVARAAAKQGALGFNDWRSSSKAAGEFGYGGPAAAFVVRSLNPGHVMAVDLRYLDPALNGGVKTQCQGEKDGYGWTADLRKLRAAHTVYVVESPINALSIDTLGLKGVAAFATRGTGNVGNIDWRWLAGKQVIACMDNDEPFPAGHAKEGERPGLKAAWDLHEKLTALDIACQLVDQDEWEVNDLNDLLVRDGPEKTARAVRRLEPWLLPGMSGVMDRAGKPRIFLPYHDATQYSHFRVRPDFTSVFTEKRTTDEAGIEKVTPQYTDLAGFRVAGLSRVRIQSAIATVTGDDDTQPNTAFAVSVQVPRHGPVLQRRVIEDEKLHNVDSWKRFGPIWTQGPFLRMINILERAAHIGSRTAANFVGLCYLEGRLTVSEGTDTYFADPKQQCPYYNLTFPSGSKQDGRAVVKAYRETFKKSAAMIPLVWALGAHLKVFLGFWPHLQMQADKGHGKSTLAARLERTVAMKVFSKETIKTAFRLVTTTAHTAHPIGWEEISANRMEVIDAAVSLLQEAYNFKPSPRGAQMLEFLTCAPVLLIGEDVPVRSLIGKLCRTELTNKKGAPLPDDLPKFPVRQWLEFLAEQQRADVREAYERLREHCLARSRASRDDDGAMRMAANYAALMTAWRFLAEFLEIDVNEGGFGQDVLEEMNHHISETTGDREPWIWIVETLLSEISAGEFRFPYIWGEHKAEDTLEIEPVIYVRSSHIMDHLSRATALREKWNGLPVKSDRVFRKQLVGSGVVIAEDVERTIELDGAGNKKRVAHLMALSLPRLERYGLYATPVSRSFDSPEPPHG